MPYLAYDERVDFAYFYAGASMAYHGDAAELYPVPGELTYYPYDPIFDVTTEPYALDRLIARGNYYNPPALAFLHAPLAMLSFRDAFWTFSGLQHRRTCRLHRHWPGGRRAGSRSCRC